MPYTTHIRQKSLSSANYLGKSKNKSFGTHPNSNSTQLTLPLLPEPSPIASFTPVEADLRLGHERFYLDIRQGDRHWRYPLQLRADELEGLARQACKWDLRLNPENGIPIDLAMLHEAMQRFIGREVGE